MASEFKKCKTCGRIFQGYGKQCPDCVEEEDRQYNLVRDYVWAHPGASMYEIVEETEVDPKLILRFLKEGRVELENADGLLTCEKCGTPISSGTLCDACKSKLSKAMDSVLPKAKASKPEPRSSSSPGMGSGKTDKLHVNVRR